MAITRRIGQEWIGDKQCASIAKISKTNSLECKENTVDTIDTTIAKVRSYQS